MKVDDYIIIDCNRLLDPNDFGRVYNDSFFKTIFDCLDEETMGSKSNKIQGVKLPGGIELNGRQIYDDAEKDLEIIRGADVKYLRTSSS